MSAPEHKQPDTIVVRQATSPDEMEEVYLIRDEVFVEEQALTPDARFDPDDRKSIHFLAYHEGKPVGTGRLTMIGREAQVAWVAVRLPFRKLGVGWAVMVAILDRAREEGADYVVLNAQSHALEFYRRLGFETFGTEFYMAGIPHQVMMLGFTQGAGEQARKRFRNGMY